MATDKGLFGLWYADSYFPPVWFAPADDSQVPEDDIRLEYRGSGTGTLFKDRFQDATEADIERLVRDKYDLLEQGRREKESPASPDAEKTVSKTRDVDTIVIDKPDLPTISLDEAIRLAEAEYQLVIQKVRQKRNDEAMALIAMLMLEES